MSTATTLSFESRTAAYLRQNNGRFDSDRHLDALTSRQLRQVSRIERKSSFRGINTPILLDEAASYRGPVSLPDLGATDPHSRMMIHFGYALQDKGKRIYAGTVSTATRAHRRATNKAARLARRAHRR